MKIPVYNSSVSGGGLLKDLQATVTLNRFTGDSALVAIAPGIQTNEAGNIVITSSVSSGSGFVSQVIQSIDVESKMLGYYIIGAALIIVGLFIWMLRR